MMILLIAIIPAVVVFFIAVGTGSKVKTTFAALIAAALGVITGNPIYMALDVAAVGLAYWLAMKVVWDAPNPAPPPVAAAAPALKPAANESDSGSFSTVLVIAALGFFAYLYLGSGSSPKTPNQQPPQVHPQPVVIVQQPYVAPLSASPQSPEIAKK